MCNLALNSKKALKNLLKENHPDNKGDSKKFELINEIKKELESGKVSYDEKLLRDNKDIDYEYCYKMIDGLRINKNNLTELINAKKNPLRKHESEYRDLYKKSLDLENNLLINIPHVKKVQNIKLLSIIILTLMIIVFTISVIKNNNILFITFIVLSIICVFVVKNT